MNKDELRRKLANVVEHLEEDISCGYEVDWVKECWQGDLQYVNEVLVPALSKKFKPDVWKINVVGYEYSNPRDDSWKIVLEDISQH